MLLRQGALWNLKVIAASHVQVKDRTTSVAAPTDSATTHGLGRVLPVGIPHKDLLRENIGGVVVPLVVTQGINGKVVFVEKVSGSGASVA